MVLDIGDDKTDDAIEGSAAIEAGAALIAEGTEDNSLGTLLKAPHSPLIAPVGFPAYPKYSAVLSAVRLSIPRLGSFNTPPQRALHKATGGAAFAALANLDGND